MYFKRKFLKQNKTYLGLILFFFFFWTFPNHVFAATLNCASCATCTSQIAAASSGDTVQLTADLTGGSDSTCITLSGTNGVILDCQNHTLTGPYFSGIPPYYFGIKMLSANSNTIRNCTVQNFYRDMDIESSSGNTFQNVTTRYSFQGGMLIHLSSSNNIVNNCVAQNNGNRGIYIYYGSNNNSILNSNLISNSLGISVEYSSGNILDNLTLDDNNYGVSIAYSENNTLRNSRIENCIDHGGIYIPPGDHNATYVKYNNIYNNYFNNTLNVEIADTANNQPNYFNTALNCSSGQNIIGGNCIGGNFWGTPNHTGYSETCVDADANKICDSAYVFSANNVDNYPLIDPLVNDLLPPAQPSGLSVE